VLKELKGGYSFDNEDSRPNFYQSLNSPACSCVSVTLPTSIVTSQIAMVATGIADDTIN
jgi:hypothetical protein